MARTGSCTQTKSKLGCPTYGESTISGLSLLPPAGRFPLSIWWPAGPDWSDRTPVLCSTPPLYALIGGFHLNGPLFEPLIPKVLDDLAELNPGVLVPAHCTGWRAGHAMASRFPEAYIPNSVGTRFLL